MWSFESKKQYTSASREDNSDRKTLDILCAQLGNLEKKPRQDVVRPEAARKSNRIAKLIGDHPSIKSGIGKSKLSGTPSKISNTKVKSTLKDNGVKFTDSPKWIKKAPVENVRSRSKSKSSKPAKKDKWKQPKLTETLNKSLEKCGKKSSKQETKKDKLPETLSSKFEKKYSMKTPTHEEIMAYRKQSEQEKEALEKLQKEMEDSLESDINFNIDESAVREDMEILDCKHLTDNEMTEYFNTNYKHMHEIHHGIRSTARSEKFKKGGDTRELRYNTSSCSFTYDQKKLLYSLLHDKFGDKNFMCTNDQYFFQVLIPELCLKIFMDVHNMTLEEATNYLDNAPVKTRI